MAKVSHQDIVKRVLDSKSVDFAAVGKIVSELGPTMAMSDEPWDNFCWTMRTFFHCYIINHPSLPLENLPQQKTRG
jgi:hypothetical protein